MRLKRLPWLIVFLTLILSGSALLLYHNFEENIHENAELHLSGLADNLLLEIAKDPTRFRTAPQTFIFLTHSNEFISGSILVQFFDQNGRIIARSPSLKSSSLPFSPDDNDLLKDLEMPDGTKLKTIQREVNINGQKLGSIIIAMPTAQIYRNLEYLRNALFIIMFCTLLILGFGINLITSLNLVENQKKFLSFASHELRTPLAIIAGHAEVALGNKATQADRREALVTIQEESEWLSRLVANLLHVFRSESGMEKINKREFNLNDLLLEECSQLKKRFHGKQINLKLATEARFNGDPDQIKRVVSNLLENAARHTTENGEIKVTLQTGKKEITLTIQDNGEGIEEKRLKKIFDPYFRIQNDKEGSGLGLAIAKWVVESHGGKIRVESKPGHGATFVVTLPKQA